MPDQIDRDFEVEGQPKIPWWCSRGGLYTVVDAAIEEEAQYRAARRFQHPHRPYRLPRTIDARPATPEDLELWQSLLAQGAMGQSFVPEPSDHQEVLFDAP